MEQGGGLESGSRHHQENEVSFNVRVVQLGKGVFFKTVSHGMTLQQFIQQNLLNTKGMEVRVNGKLAEKGHILTHNDLITLVPLIKGGGQTRNRFSAHDAL